MARLRPRKRTVGAVARKLAHSQRNERRVGRPSQAQADELLIMKELIPFFTSEDKEWIMGRTAMRVYGFGRTGQG